MSLWRQVGAGLRVLTRRASANRELSDEVQYYYDQEVAALEASGLTRVEAEREARLRLGDPSSVLTEVRTHGWENALEAVLIDLRHAARRLRNNPGFAVVSILTLGLGIGAVTAIFSAVKPILFDPLPYDGADRIVMVSDRAQDGSQLDVTFGSYREIVERSRSFASLAVMRTWQPTVTDAVAEPVRLDGQRVSASYFDVLGVAPALGRGFRAAEDQAGGESVVILSHALWQRRFAADRGIVGRQITLNGYPFLVVGVMPAGFENVLSATADLWSPLQYDASLPPDGREWGHHLRMVGRLRPGVDREMAIRELARIAQTPIPQFVRVPWASLGNGLTVSSLQDDLTRGVRPALLAVLGAVFMVLIIACVNVTNLLLAKGAQRNGELALRAALGAGRNRLIAQLIVETLLLSLLGAAVGIGVAQLGIRALIALSPPELPRVSAIRLDAAVFGFAFAVATTIGLLVGWFVALHASRRQSSAGVQRRSSRVTGGNQSTRRALVVAQVALAVVLLVSGGLLLRSLERLFSVDPGFDPEQLVTMQVQTAGLRFEDAGVTYQFFAQALDAVRAVPGVASAAFTSQLPLTGDFQKYGLHLESAPASREEEDGSGFRYAVTADYFETMGIPLRRGRLFTEQDGAGTPHAIVINESLARRRFGDLDPIGSRVKIGSSDQPWATVVGIVGDVKQMSLAGGEENAAYLPTTQGYFADRTLWLVVRARGNAAALAPAIRNAIWSVDKDQPITRITTMSHMVSQSAAERLFTLIIFDAFALVALLLAAIGLYGVLAGGVSERLREIGVRSALGASRVDIVGLIVRQALTLTTLGLVIGLAGATAAARAIRTLLFDISQLDPVTYAGVLLLMLGVCAAAAWLPALRAVRVQPSIALKAE